MMSAWMLNHAKTRQELKNMCQMMFVNTKHGGKCLALLPTLGNDLGMLLDCMELTGIYVKGLREIKEEGRVVGLQVDKEIKGNGAGDNESGFVLRDWFYSDKTIRDALEEAGFENVRQVPSVPVKNELIPDST